MKTLTRHLCSLILGVALLLVAVALFQGAASAQTPSWRQISQISTAALAIDPSNSNVIYLGSYNGVFKSTDGGESWVATNFRGTVVHLTIDFVNPNVVYAAIIPQLHSCFHSDRRLFKSTDSGVSWNSGASPPINGCDFIHALTIDPTESNTLYVANYDDNNGDSWTPLIKTSNAGASWLALFGPPLFALAIDPHDHNVVYGGTSDLPYFGYDGWDYRNGVLRSTDGGAHWSTTGLTEMGVNVIAVNPRNPAVVYAAGARNFNGWPMYPRSFQGLFKTTDSGNNWTAINDGLTQIIGTTSVISALVIDPVDPNILYAATTGRGVFKSNNGGSSWTSLGSGLTNQTVESLVLAPGNSRTLYAGTPGGVFKIVDTTSQIYPNPIYNAQFFVRQHYLDFLSREPEAGEPWTAVLNNCPDINNDPACDRITVSAAFLGSPEFSLKGYFVYRFYKLAFNRLPAYAEIARDMQLVTGQTQSDVFERKAAFTNAYVQRGEWLTTYNAMTNTQYVSTLLSRYGLSQITTPDPVAPDGSNKVTLTTVDLINQLDAHILTRAQVLRAVADSDEVFAAEYNQAFVAMQYYGYLRRTPEPAGYNAWLDYLNANPTDFRTMVNGFVNSIEYRSRFGP